MIGVKVTGIEALESALRQLSEVRFEAVEKKQLADILKRARQPGGTPVDTGELRQSARVSGKEMGYTKEYAFQSCGAYKTGQKRQKLSLRVA